MEKLHYVKLTMGVLRKQVVTHKSWQFTVIISRGKKYDEKGNRLPGRRVPTNWKDHDHNPANIPSAWKPDNWVNLNKIDFEMEKVKKKYIPGYKPKLRYEQQSEYKKDPAYVIEPHTVISEGLDQALSLTKSILMDTKLPSSIHDLAKKYVIPNQDKKVTDIFRHALLFDIDPKTQTYTKNDYNSREIHNNFKIYSSPERYVPLIVQNMLSLCQYFGSTYPNIFSRIQARSLKTSSFFVRRLDSAKEEFHSSFQLKWNVLITGNPGMQILAKKPLQPFADTAAVKNSINREVCSTFPVLPISGTEKQHIYKNTSFSGLEPNYSCNALHTMIINNTSRISIDNMYGTMATFLFSALYSRAQSLHGNVEIDLETPLVGQCISTDGQFFQYMAMQLNTTKLQTDNGIKNMVWIESPPGDTMPDIPEIFVQHRSLPMDEIPKYRRPYHIRRYIENSTQKYHALPLYSACSHRLWKEKDYYSHYDQRIFQLVLGMFLNGVIN